MSSVAPPRVLFYVQHLLGLGHLMRASRIASALQDHGFQVTLITGGVTEPEFHVPGVEHVALPSIAVRGSDFSILVDSEDNPINNAFKIQRCQQLLEAYAQINPAIVMIEAFPFGRRQMQFELLPLIECIESSVPKPVLVSSLRDVVQRRSKPGRDAETATLVKQHFDKVLVHGDPQVAALAESFSHAADIDDQIIYTGLVFDTKPCGEAQSFDVVVSAGGGAVGYPLIRAAMQAALMLPSTMSWCVVTGPNIPESEFIELVGMAQDNVVLERFRDDFPALLSATSLSISQAGYNTVNDVMRAGCRAVLVPYSAHGETEQTDRAMRMSQLGKATIIKESELSSQVLASVVPTVLSQAPPVTSHSIPNGAEQTALILKELIGVEC